jgi:hypothetical protein
MPAELEEEKLRIHASKTFSDSKIFQQVIKWCDIKIISVSQWEHENELYCKTSFTTIEKLPRMQCRYFYQFFFAWCAM